MKKSNKIIAKRSLNIRCPQDNNFVWKLKKELRKEIQVAKKMKIKKRTFLNNSRILHISKDNQPWIVKSKEN